MAVTVKPDRPYHCVWGITLKCNMRCKHLPSCRGGCSAQAYFATGQVSNNPFCMLAERRRRAQELRTQAQKATLTQAAELEKEAKRILRPERPFPRRMVRAKFDKHCGFSDTGVGSGGIFGKRQAQGKRNAL